MSLYKRLCKTTFHQAENDNCQLFDFNQRRFVSSEVKNYLLQKNYITQRPNRTASICSACIERVLSDLNSTPLVPPPSSGHQVPGPSCEQEEPMDTTLFIKIPDSTVTEVVEALDANALTMLQLQQLAEAFGRYCAKYFKSDKQADILLRKAQMKMPSYEVVWNMEENQVWKTFLASLCKVGNFPTQSTWRRLSKCTELVRAEIDTSYVSNFALGEAALLLQFSDSKYAVDLFCKTNGGGSFSTMRRALNLIKAEPFILPNVDVSLVFDNSQVVQRTWIFKFGTKQPISTVTTCISLLNKEKQTTLQSTLHIPTAMFPSESNREILFKHYLDFMQTSNEKHQAYRKQFITSRLQHLKQQFTVVGENVTDIVSTESWDNDTIDDVFKYGRIPSRSRIGQITDIPCIPENPNSYVSVSHVLDRIQEYMQQSSTVRNFLPIYMDGSPYNMCINILRETYICNSCLETVKADEIDNHCKTKHQNISKDSLQWTRKYRNLVIRPGSGHIEMTAVKAIMSTFWVPIIQPVAKIMGFSSDAQQQYILKCYDHHKAYCLLMVIFAALSDELLYPYVKDALENHKEVSIDGYLKWQSEMTNNHTYMFLWDFAFITLHSLQLFRTAIRTCNDEIALAVRDKLTSLFFATNNVKYQELISYDTLYMMSIPNEGREAVYHESCRQETSEFAEGYDFILENRNKLYKSYLPSDSCPTFEQWLNTTSNAGALLELRNVAAARLDMNIKKGETRKRKFEPEIMQTRKYFRSLGVLSEKKAPLLAMTTTRQNLDPCMLNYVRFSEANKKNYLKEYLAGRKARLPLLNTKAEVLDLRNSTIEDISEALKRKILQLHEPFFSMYKKYNTKKLSADDSVNLYKSVVAQLEMQNDQCDLEDFCFMYTQL